MSLKGTVLIVDDESYVRDSLAALLERRGFRVRTAEHAGEALAAGALEGVDAVVTDLKMPGTDGRALLGRLVAQAPSLPVVVLTGHGSVLSAVDCMKAGAWDYLQKPANPEELVLVIDRALTRSGLDRELAYLRSGVGSMDRRRQPLGVSAAWREVMEMAALAATADTAVLVVGESGTGKEEVARQVHAKSARSRGPFVPVNCAAIPDELFESEFFGHRRGAFTGAVADRDGRFRVAHRGTLFMDEIDSLPERAQAKVLRVIEDGVFERVGDSQPTTVDVRLVSASNVDLEAAVEAGAFRADLFYRINVLTIHIPPLRERREDVAPLAASFLEEFCARLARRLSGIDPAAMAALQGYPWPGNVRELRNVIERGVLLERGDRLTVDSLPFSLREEGPSAGQPAGPASGPGAAGDPGLNLRARLASAERATIEEALRRAFGVRREAARLLGIDERNLAYFLKKNGLMDWGKPE